MKPLCFVLTPFGHKPDLAGGTIDFDALYRDVIRPAIDTAGMEPIRADEETSGGVIHKSMFERLILCEYAIADLTAANPDVLYELGVRHGIRPRTTIMMVARHSRLPFDIAQLRSVPYSIKGGLPADAEADAARLSDELTAVRTAATDSPVFQLVDDLPPTDISRLKTDVFRARVEYASDLKTQIARARSEGIAALEKVRATFPQIGDLEFGVLIDLFLSYRALQAWSEMIELVAAMPEPLARSVMVREQLGLALNRSGQGEDAERVLLDLIEERGPSSETFGILGRVYKDRWTNATDAISAQGHLRRAIEAYLKGFEADWRDAYPGVNVVTLMELDQPPDPRRLELLPVVRYAGIRRVAKGTPDYWDYATLLELDVLSKDRSAAYDNAAHAITRVREAWEPESTISNLTMIRDAWAERGEDVLWIDAITDSLREASASG